MAFCIGWIPELTCSARARTRARPSAVGGRSGGDGWTSSSHSMMAIDWTSRRSGRPLASTSSTGTWWVGLRARWASDHCAPPARSTATYWYSSPFRASAMRTRHEELERQ